MKTQYVADDGTIFFNAKECATYEKSLKKCGIEKSRFWIGNKEPMSVEEFLKDPRGCDFIEVALGEEEAIYRIFEEEHIVNPWDGYCPLASGRYYYSPIDDEWRDYEVIEEEYLKAKKIFEGE